MRCHVLLANYDVPHALARESAAVAHCKANQARGGNLEQGTYEPVAFTTHSMTRRAVALEDLLTRQR